MAASETFGIAAVSQAGAALPATTGKRARILIPLIVGCAFFMEGLAPTMIAVSIPAMAKSLGESPLRLNLVITAYLLSLAVFIPVSGWIADRFGARRVFCAAVLLFAGGSALCGLATSLPMLIAMRVVQGLGGAMMTPALGYAFFPLALIMLLAYAHHARHSPSPVLDLSLFSIKTFHIGTVTGGICRMGLDATPFLLPLLFQIGFGLSPTQAGILSFSSTLGALFVRVFSRFLLRLAGFRRTLVWGARASAASSAA